MIQLYFFYKKKRGKDIDQENQNLEAIWISYSYSLPGKRKNKKTTKNSIIV